MTRRTGSAVLAGVLLAWSAAAQADDLESVEKRIVSAWDQHKSMTARLEMSLHLETGGRVLDGKTEGTLAWMKKGDRVYARMEQKSTMTSKKGGQEKRQESSSTIVVDGEFEYTLTEVMGQKTAVKSNIEPEATGDTKAILRNLRKDDELKLLPNETVAGKQAFVIEAIRKVKPDNPGQPARRQFYFDQDTGAVLKVASFNNKDELFDTLTFADFKFDVDLSPERFQFKAPDGVEVSDMTGATRKKR